MYQIMRMAEVVREKGVQIYELIETPNGKTKTIVSKSKTAEALFWSLIEQNNPFCFSKTGDAPQEIGSLVDADLAAINMSEFDAPFDVFSIEVINSLITVANYIEGLKKVDIAAYLIATGNGIKTLNDEMREPLPMDVAAVFVLYLYENQPYVFLEFMYNQKDTISSGKATILRFDNFDGKSVRLFASNVHSEIIKKFTDRLNSHKIVGYEKIHGRIKKKNPDGSKQIIRIKRIIHIATSKQQKTYSSDHKIDVNWSHRFWRRGHWAHFWKDKENGVIDYDRLGKNRDGVYCVRGKTWKVETIVGEDHLPLITKPRVIGE